MLRLRAERLQRGWTGAKLARKAEIDQALIYEVAARRVVPYDRELLRLARALRLPPSAAKGLMAEVDDVDAAHSDPPRGPGVA